MRRTCAGRVVTDDPGSLLTSFQIEVAQLFFSLPASGGFLLAGGGALLAQGLTARPTQDLDFFTRPDAGDVGLARTSSWQQPASRAGLSTGCRTAVRSVDYSSTDPRTCSSISPWTPHQVARRARASLDRRSRRTNSPDARSSPCSTVPRLATSSMSTR